MRFSLAAVLSAFLLPASSAAQGYAGLGTQAEGFAEPDRATVLTFPRDHGAHPRFRIEWWYLTANLKDADGRDYGVQWTLFRSALRPGGGIGWDSPQIWMGHAALTSPYQHLSAERITRGGNQEAGVTADPFQAWIGNWEMAGEGLDLSSLSVAASGADFRYALDLAAETPLVLHGDAGFSVKSANGQASHYYSQPAYSVSGHIETRDGLVAVQGTGWLDREWSSQPLSEDQQGWDWFSLKFDDDWKLMGFVLRGSRNFTSGTLISPDGRARSIEDGGFLAVPLKTGGPEDRPVPTQWRITVPEHGIEATVTAINPDSWMRHSFSYWEGPVQIAGERSGTGYLEMTGY